MAWSVPVLVILQLASQAPAGGASRPPCPVALIDAHPLAGFLDDRSRAALTEGRNKACEGVAAKRMTVAVANDFLSMITHRLAVCRGSAVNPDYSASLDKGPIPGVLRVVFGEFCKRTDGSSGFDPNVLRNRLEWLRAELFCAASDYIADPSGWVALFRSNAPSEVRLRERADTLCAQAREKKLSANEAWYRFDLEMERVRDRLGAETALQVGSSFKSVMGALLDLVK